MKDRFKIIPTTKGVYVKDNHTNDIHFINHECKACTCSLFKDFLASQDSICPHIEQARKYLHGVEIEKNETNINEEEIVYNYDKDDDSCEEEEDYITLPTFQPDMYDNKDPMFIEDFIETFGIDQYSNSTISGDIHDLNGKVMLL